jgi:hypothetical protein
MSQLSDRRPPTNNFFGRSHAGGQGWQFRSRYTGEINRPAKSPERLSEVNSPPKLDLNHSELSTLIFRKSHRKSSAFR